MIGRKGKQLANNGVTGGCHGVASSIIFHLCTEDVLLTLHRISILVCGISGDIEPGTESAALDGK